MSSLHETRSRFQPHRWDDFRDKGPARGRISGAVVEWPSRTGLQRCVAGGLRRRRGSLGRAFIWYGGAEVRRNGGTQPVSNFIANEPLRAGTAVHIAWNALVPKRFGFNAKPVLEHPERRFTAAALPPRTPAMNDLRLSERARATRAARGGVSMNDLRR